MAINPIGGGNQNNTPINDSNFTPKGPGNEQGNFSQPGIGGGNGPGNFAPKGPGEGGGSGAGIQGFGTGAAGGPGGGINGPNGAGV